jgi:hypothetical protein
MFNTSFNIKNLRLHFKAMFQGLPFKVRVQCWDLRLMFIAAIRGQNLRIILNLILMLYSPISL